MTIKIIENFSENNVRNQMKQETTALSTLNNQSETEAAGIAESSVKTITRKIVQGQLRYTKKRTPEEHRETKMSKSVNSSTDEENDNAYSKPSKEKGGQRPKPAC